MRRGPQPKFNRVNKATWPSERCRTRCEKNQCQPTPRFSRASKTATRTSSPNTKQSKQRCRGKVFSLNFLLFLSVLSSNNHIFQRSRLPVRVINLPLCVDPRIRSRISLVYAEPKEEASKERLAASRIQKPFPLTSNSPYQLLEESSSLKNSFRKEQQLAHLRKIRW